jgi:hypothetical protein
MREQRNPDSERLHFGRTFIDTAGKAAPMEVHGECQAGNAATNDDDLHLKLLYDQPRSKRRRCRMEADVGGHAAVSARTVCWGTDDKLERHAAALAQPVERRIVVPDVEGSNPSCRPNQR